MKKQFFKLLTCCLALALFSQCTNQETDLTNSNYDTLGLEIYEELHIKGQNEFKNHWISYEITLEKDDLYLLSLQIGEKELQMKIGYSPMYLEQIGNNVVLNKTEKVAITDFAHQFSLLLADNNDEQTKAFVISQAENALYRVTDFWSNAPKDVVYENKVATIDFSKGTGNDGIYCIRKGRWYTLQYTSSSNSVITKTKKAGYDGSGSYDCMGRCGADCGRWWIPSSWTLDCFEHDQCSLDFGAAGGGGDSNCGDEWWDAVDDWSFGVGAGCFG